MSREFSKEQLLSIAGDNIIANADGLPALEENYLIKSRIYEIVRLVVIEVKAQKQKLP